MSGPANRNGLDFWFPKIEAAGLPVPETRIVSTSVDLTPLLDGITPDGFWDFIARLTEAATEIGGLPIFLRTSHGSGKHQWRDTCFVAEERFARHVTALVEWSHLAHVLGLPHDVWAVRKLLDTQTLFTCEQYEGFPVTREFRLFVRDATIEHVQPYWPPDAIEEGKPDRDDWREVLAEASWLGAFSRAEICALAARACAAVGGGYWSVDCLQDRNGEWYVTDMAEGDLSFRWEPEP